MGAQAWPTGSQCSPVAPSPQLACVAALSLGRRTGLVGGTTQGLSRSLGSQCVQSKQCRMRREGEED